MGFPLEKCIQALLARHMKDGLVWQCLNRRETLYSCNPVRRIT